MTAFATFFAAAHPLEDGTPGPAPYPWQESLAHRLATAEPPRAIVVPTGGGKTATIDALLWALAQQADRAPALRSVGVRTVWAIDRRILVDEVHDHVERLTELLDRALTDSGDALHHTAAALASFTDGGPPLVATRWRGGGVPVDRAVRHPLQPEVITSTVAQVGSRLLFRGYGVGARSLSVQAAITGVDTNLCLDEAHLAEPFRQTVEAVVEARRTEVLALPPLHLITLTATPPRALAAHEVTVITDADRPLLGPRLTGVKRARLIAPDSERARRLALLGAIGAHLDDGARTVACVVNTVKAAVEVHAAVTRAQPGCDHMLLIGPQRPVDRAVELERHRETLFARHDPEVPLILVATQTFEVGLDADVEALVTESASAAALVQRLGRLNRAGLRRGAATIVRADAAGLYEQEEPAAWAWLESRVEQDGTVDVSVDAVAERPEPLPAAPAPALTDDVLERLVQTEPRPATMDDPDVDVFLRGAGAEPAADVSIAWRGDLRPGDPDAAGYRRALLALAPPQRDECVTLGIGRARALVAALRAPSADRRRLGGRVLDEPDLEGTQGADERREAGDRALVYVVLRGGECLEAPEPVRPGDVLVLPSAVGGYSGQALDLASTLPVVDVAPDRRGGAAPFFRLSREALYDVPPEQRRRLLAAAGRAEAEDGDRPEALAAVAERLALGLGTTRKALGLEDALLDLRRVTTTVDLFADGGFFRDDEEEPGILTLTDDEYAVGEAFVLLARTTVDELRTAATPPPTLEEHAQAVAARTARYADAAGLPAAERAALVLAARAHDHGKAEPRTQAYFCGGSAGLGLDVLAKSVFGTRDVQADRAARTASGLPSRLRHEVESVGVLLDVLGRTGAEEELDTELLLHLVGTHHGLGRPVPRFPRGGAPVRAFAVSAAGIAGTGSGSGAEAWGDGAWLERFLAVTERYGPWGSAYLGALLVLADRSVSGEGA